jgi:hypothetical protein
MGIQIEDGTGKGFSQAVNKFNEALVSADSKPIQHVVSVRDAQAYQVIGDFASINNSTHTVLHIQNTSSTKVLIITYIRVQTIDLAGGTAPPSATNYWQLGTGRTVSSGGSSVAPVNVNFSSGNVAAATCTDNNPTMTGTFTEIDRYYIESEGDSAKYNKEGAIVLGKDDTFEARITASSTSGTGYVRVSFYFEDIE